ncbi:MAG: 1-deoxy-D-xylulose-5-phosphate synthase [Gammaproteobacteria bacterium]|nr:1-deoxy-D-xylulose-5-phosphate synthase [Gammaproteobacteria bacterium]
MNIFQDRRYPLLDTINLPADLRQLDKDQLPQLADELRQYIIELVSRTGGHLASGLGAVEITIALHYLFNTPDDRLIWDVGHQCYPHKILTGRRHLMPGLRQKDGISGFPKPAESEYDHFGVGHSSTSISAALGMAIAAQAHDVERDIVAIIGDGGMSAGMAFEALNHAGALDTNLLVVLNDNEMSISPNVGAMSKYLSRIWSGSFYSHLRSGSKKVLSTIPSAWELAKRAEEHIKGMVVPGTLFEELGFHYFGPIDGHDLPSLLKLLSNLKKIEGPRLLHIVTQKGKGYEPAESDACKYHGTGPFDIATGAGTASPSTDKQTFTQAFSAWVVKKAEADPYLHVITPAMREGSGLVEFSSQYAQRFHDVGIAEQHAVTLAAGMATEGLKPIVAIYSTFLQRAYDQLVHDVAIQNLDVLFAVDRAGVVGADGATHSGNFDISYCRCIPGMLIMTPANTEDLHALLNTGYHYPGPALVRYPRDNCQISPDINTDVSIEIGQSELLREGKSIAILVFGPFLDLAGELAERYDCSLVNMRFVKPLDAQRLHELSQTHQHLLCLEDNSIIGGAGSAVGEWLQQQNLPLHCVSVGLQDSFPSQGSRQQVLEEYQFDQQHLAQKIEQILAKA